MQKLALLFLFAITTSMILALETPILAQEASEEPSGEEMTGEEPSGEEMTGEEPSGEEIVDEETMADTMMEEGVDSPLEQMTAGVDPHEIQCMSGQKLVFKASNWRPSCINESSFDVLLARGWVSIHDPSQDDLAMMMDDYMMAHPEEEVEEEVTEDNTEEEIQIEEDVTVEEETTTGNGTETETEGETQPQSYSVELSESMDMGAQ